MIVWIGIGWGNRRRHISHTGLSMYVRSVSTRVLVFMLLMMPLSCGKSDEGERFTDYPTATSPDGKWVAKRSAGPRHGYVNDVWTIRITDAEGQVVFTDHTDFTAVLNVYVMWDEDHFLWLYNSDDGRVYYYSQGPTGWQRDRYCEEDHEGRQDAVGPPSDLFPQ